MKRSRVPATICIYHCFIAFISAVLLLSATPSHAVGTFIPATNAVDMLYDSQRELLYITRTNLVLRYHIASNVFLTPITLTGSLRRMDLAPDGNTLLITDGTWNTTNSWFHVINLTDGTSRKATFPRIAGEGGTFDVAWANDGTALFTTSRDPNSGSNFAFTIRRFDFATTNFTWIRYTSGETEVAASANRSILAIKEPNSWGATHRYDASTRTLTRTVLNSVATSLVTVNRDGSRFAAEGYFYDENLSVIKSMSGPVAGAYHPTADAIFFTWNGTKDVRM